jgi:signal transduction histidine kinase
VALAAMKLDDPRLVAGDSAALERRREIEAIRASLDEALQEIRTICGGLILPHIETAGISEVIRRAARRHEQRTGTRVDLDLPDEQAATISAARKICIYRFVQEGLANASRHAGGAGQMVRSTIAGGRLTIEVSDKGPGFDPGRLRADALGLAGLRQRINSLGGSFAVETSGRGTTLRVILDLEEVLAA